MDKTGAKSSGKRFGLIAIAMYLMSRGQMLFSSGEEKLGAAMVAVAGLIALGYEAVNEYEFKGS